jgi:hypothetical protein
MAKYQPLQRWLATQSDRQALTMNFADVEQVLGERLPASAHNHRAWWADDASHVHATAWPAAGWPVEGVDQVRRNVRLRREK